MSRIKRLQNRINESVKGFARPIAKQGFGGLRAGINNLIMPASMRHRGERIGGYGSGLYSGAYAAIASMLKDLRGDPTGLAMAAETSEVLYNCIMVRCNAISGLPWGIYPKKGRRNSESKVEGTAFHRMHQYAQTEFEQNFFYLWELSLSVHGEVFFEKLKLFDALPGGLRYLNRIVIEPFVTNGRVDHYTYNGDDGIVNFKPHELVRHAYPNLLDDFSGSAPLSRALDHVNADRYTKQHVRSYFKNGAKIGGWLTLRQGSTLTDVEWERLRSEFSAHMTGPENAYKWGLLPAELEAKSADNQPFDHFQELTDNTIKRMHWAMQVSPVLTGAIPASDPLSSLGTLDAAKAFLFESWVDPEAKSIAQIVNQDILPWLMMDEYEFAFDVDSILSTMRQTKDRSEKVRSEYRDTAISHSEMREALGYDPEPAFADLWYVDGIGLVPKTEVPKIWEKRILIAPSVYNSELITGEPLPQPVDPNQVVPTENGGQSVADPSAPPAEGDANKDALPGGKPLCLLLTLADDPDLISLQNRVKAYMADTRCKWNEPSDYHVTLVYAPAVSDEQFRQVDEQIKQIELPELKLNIGSLNVFENVGEFAVHFRIRQNADLLALQSKLFEICKAAGIAMSSYSTPAAYIPHVTMGYAESKPRPVRFNSKLRLTPSALHLCAGDDVMSRVSMDEDDPEEPDPQSGDMAHKGWGCDCVLNESSRCEEHAEISNRPPQDDALDELRAWEKKAVNKGVTKAFKVYLVRDEVAEGIRLALAEVGDDRDGIRLVFDRAREIVSYKAIQATRIDFEDAFEDLLKAARNDESSRRQFSASLRYLLNRFGKMAYLDGLRDGGIDDPVLDDEDNVIIAEMLADNSAYVSNLGGTVFGSGVSDAQAAQKPAMWFNKSIMPFYHAGLASADKNALYEWVLGRTEEHCATCLALNGQRHRYREYALRGLLPKSDKLDCKGFHCDCKLVKVAGRARGNWLEMAA